MLAPKVDRVWNFGEPRADRICPVIMVTYVRIMPSQEHYVETMQTASIVLQVIGATILIIMQKLRNALIIIGDSAPVQCKSY